MLNRHRLKLYAHESRDCRRRTFSGVEWCRDLLVLDPISDAIFEYKSYISFVHVSPSSLSVSLISEGKSIRKNQLENSFE